MKVKPVFFIAVVVAIVSASCEYGRQAEEKLRELNIQAEQLDAAVKQGIENVPALDSILPEASKKLKEADSIVKDASATLDSLNERVNSIREMFN